MMLFAAACHRLQHAMTLLVLPASLLMATTIPSARAAQFDIIGPPGSVAFGARVAVLPNGNIVVTDPNRIDGAAVYLYSPTGTQISTLTSNGTYGPDGITITVLKNGNYLIVCPQWRNGSIQSVGAVTWANGETGISGVVSTANSLTGAAAGDMIGNSGIVALKNGNYIVKSGSAANGSIVQAGAVTWGNGKTGISGVISTANSLMGTSFLEKVGFWGVFELSNGNYVVRSPFWGDGNATNLGAVTWANGNTGISGVITSANSLVGATEFDYVGNNGVVPLTNGNYVVASRNWRNGEIANAGAVTWANGSTGLVGPVTTANSLVGTLAGNFVGHPGVTALSNGNYVVKNSDWEGKGQINVGAVTWANGSTGLVGVVSPSNSLVGTTDFDFVGDDEIEQLGVNALTNGNYVITSTHWDNDSHVDVGAVTWADGSKGITGPISVENSLIGATDEDFIGNAGVTALTNGNYVVSSIGWQSSPGLRVGAATWGDGRQGVTGKVSLSNSLIGRTSNDQVGTAIALSNGNYVISSVLWDNNGVNNVGAVTWANGNTGLAGIVTPENSLIGSSTIDFVGTVIPLRNGNFVVASQNWDNGSIVNAGAVTWVNGNTATHGVVSPNNSLVGTFRNDQVGDDHVVALPNGGYVISSLDWDNGDIVNASAITLAGSDGLVGTIDASNSVIGTAPFAGVGETGGAGLVYAYDAARERLVVGRFASSIVSLFSLPSDLIFTDGFETGNPCPLISFACQ